MAKPPSQLQLENKPWWNYLEEDLRELFIQSTILMEKAGEWDGRFHDYSFVVFPAAKAYEGFLKKLFLDLGFITQEDYYGKRWRVGRALNPQLEPRLRHESVYDKLKEYCHGTVLPDQLWEAWRQGRNLIFHWFPEEKRAISLDDARARIEMIVRALDQAFKECKIK